MCLLVLAAQMPQLRGGGERPMGLHCLVCQASWRTVLRPDTAERAGARDV